MVAEVQDFCQKCPQYQKTTPYKLAPAPLIPLPIIEVLFEWVGMDLVAPLPNSANFKLKVFKIMTCFKTKVKQRQIQMIADLVWNIKVISYIIILLVLSLLCCWAYSKHTATETKSTPCYYLQSKESVHLLLHNTECRKSEFSNKAATVHKEKNIPTVSENNQLSCYYPSARRQCSPKSRA